MGVYYIDQKFVVEEEAVIPISDLALLRGYGAFDFLRTYGGRPFFLKEHLIRLQRSAELLDLACPWSLKTLEDIVIETLGRNSHRESNIRIVITGGDSLDSITPEGNTKLLVMVTEVQPFPEKWYSKGVKVITSDITRFLPGAKSTNYTKAIHTLREAHNQGAIESIYTDEDGRLFEGTTSNFFLVRGRKIITPEKGILPGITRKVVLQLAEGVFDVELRPVFKKEIPEADEVFLTSSNKEIAPVTKVDDITIGTGTPGNITVQLMSLFKEFKTKYCQEM